MPNNTFEDYKNAVKKKYEIEKDGGHFVYLNNPTRARLRNLCWELFQQQNRNQDDLNVFSSLLGLAFDVNKKNKFEEQIDKFRPIETFFKGETDPTNVDSVNLAAILVNFEARPFNKFRIQSLYQDEIQNDNRNNSEILNPETEQIGSSGILESFLDKKESEKGKEVGIEKRREKENFIEEIELKPINLFVNFKDNFLEKFKKNLKQTIIRVVIVFGLGFAISHYFFPKKAMYAMVE